MRIAFLFLLALSFSCSQHDKQHSAPAAEDSLTLTYAKGFKVRYEQGAKWVEVLYPFQGATSGYKYLLVDRGEKIPAHDKETKVISIPIKSLVCTSTTHIPLLEYINETEKLVGFPTPDYISSQKMRSRINQGKVVDVGIDKSLNVEMLVTLKPSILMGYTMTGDYGQFKKIEELGVPVVINAEYLEKHPLGRAEWIKFVSLFFNKEKEADSVFASIEHNYLQTKRTVDTVTYKPKVLSGIVYGDAWFLPGGQNYAAKLFADAGYDYLWSDNTSNGFLQISFETVYERARDADFWIGVSSMNSLQELENLDHRYALFKPFKQQNVFSYNLRQGEKGGSEFLELGYLRPDLILKDLVKIAHPKLMPKHELFFHKQLK